jgi:hypothetical protein
MPDLAIHHIKPYTVVGSIVSECIVFIVAMSMSSIRSEIRLRGNKKCFSSPERDCYLKFRGCRESWHAEMAPNNLKRACAQYLHFLSNCSPWRCKNGLQYVHATTTWYRGSWGHACQDLTGLEVLEQVEIASYAWGSCRFGGIGDQVEIASYAWRSYRFGGSKE